MKIAKFKLSKSKTVNLSISFILAIVLALIPWERYRSEGYYDRMNYINYLEFYENKIYWFDFTTLASKISNEWGWHYFLNVMSNILGFNSITILFIISVFHLTITFYFVTQYKNKLTIILLLNPVYIDFFYSQSRLCFAITFLYLAIMMYKKHKITALIFILISLFIHTSSIVFLMIFFGALFLASSNKLNHISKMFISIFIGIISSVITGPLMSTILQKLEDRRTEYADMSPSILFSLFWVILFTYIIYKFLLGKLKSYNSEYFFVTVSIVTLVFTNIFITGYSSRFVAASFPFLILTLSEFGNKNEYLILYLYIFSTIIYWFMWVI